MNFAEKIKIKLKEMRKSQFWLAIKMGVTEKTIQNKLKNNTFTVSEVFFISNLLEIKED